MLMRSSVERLLIGRENRESRQGAVPSPCLNSLSREGRQEDTAACCLPDGAASWDRTAGKPSSGHSLDPCWVLNYMTVFSFDTQVQRGGR